MAVRIHWVTHHRPAENRDPKHPQITGWQWQSPREMCRWFIKISSRRSAPSNRTFSRWHQSAGRARLPCLACHESHLTAGSWCPLRSDGRLKQTLVIPLVTHADRVIFYFKMCCFILAHDIIRTHWYWCFFSGWNWWKGTKGKVLQIDVILFTFLMRF